MNERMTMQEIKATVAAARAHVDALNNGAKWRICISLKPDDSDVVISNALDCVGQLLQEVQRLETELETERRRGKGE